MTQIARLKTAQIANGNVINADDISVELNQLVDESNAQDTRVTSLESGNMTIQGTKTFATAPKLDKMEESTAGNGILAEEVRLKQGSVVLSSVIRINGVNTTTERLSTSIPHGLTTGTAVRLQTDNTLPSPLSSSTTYYVNVASATEVTLHTTTSAALAGTGAVNLTTSGTGTHALLADPPSVSNGQLWFNAAQQQVKARLNNATWSLLTTQFLAGIMQGPVPYYSSASSIVLPAGLRALNSTNTHLIEVTSNITMNMGSAGINGLDTGTEANDTWYYVYLIGDSTGTNSPAAVFSTVNEANTGSITLPTGYNIKRQLPLAVRNNASGDIIPFSIGAGWPYKPFIEYNVQTSYFNGAYVTGTTNVLNAGTQTTFTDVSLAAFQPPISKMVYLAAFTNGASHFGIRPDGTTHEGHYLGGLSSSANNTRFIPTVNSVVEYKRQNGTNALYLDVMGYVVTEV